MRPVGLFADSALIRPLLSGLPLRFYFQLELWHDKFLADNLVDRSAWSLILYQEPLSGDYGLTFSWDLDTVEWFVSLEAAARKIEAWYQAPIDTPEPNSGNYYYDASLEIEILSLGDLDELERWLRGDVGGDASNIGSVFGRGLKRLFIRVIGLSARRYEARTELFAP